MEGIEGSGKSTLAGSLAREMEKAGCRVVATAEPGGSGVGERIRELLLDPSCAINPRAELLLFEAARAQHVDTLIIPALESGAVVVSDRFRDSTTAYQGYARGIDLELVEQINRFATRGLRPDLTLLLDLPVDIGLARQRRVDRMSAEDIEFHERVRQGFLAIARSEPDRFVVLDAARPFDEVCAAAYAAARKALADRA